MNKGKNDLLVFLGGLVMMAAGLFIFSNKVTVHSSLFGMGAYSMFGMRIPSGLVIVPLIIGVVWMFLSDGSLVSKLFTAISVVFIIASIIMTTTLTLDRMRLFDWVLILVLIFGGGAMVAKETLVHKDYGDDDDAPRRKKRGKFSDSSSYSSVDSQLDDIRRNMK